MKRLLLFVTVVFFAGALLTGCSSKGDITATGGKEDGDNSKVLRLNLNDEPTVFDPATQEDYVSGIISRQMFDGLMRPGKDGKPEKSLAKKIKVSDDKKTYTFTLRDSEWKNGDPVTAKDFRYAWLRILNKKTGSNEADELFFIKNAEDYYDGDAKKDDVGIKAVNDKTLKVTLEHPTEYFLEYLTSPALSPEKKSAVEDEKQWANDPDTAGTNGPFKLKTYKPQDKLILVKNKNYWDKENVHLNKIKFSIVNDENTELELFNQGKLDWAGPPVGELPFDAAESLKKKDKLHSQQMARSVYVRFNTERKPFTNKKIRKAFAYALNRKAIVDGATLANETPLMGYIPKTMSLKPKGYFKDHNVSEEKKLLKEGMDELGISKLPKVTFLYNTDPENKKVAQILQAQLKKTLGAEVSLKHEESKVFFDDQNHMKFDFSISGLTATYNDPIGFLKNYRKTHTNVNNTLWHSDEYNKYLNKAKKEPDTKKRNQYMEKAESIMMDEMPLTGLYTASNYWVQKDNVKRYRMDPTGHIDYKWVYKKGKK